MPLRYEHALRSGRPCLRLIASDGATAEVSLHGAHVTSWQPQSGRERLYLSPNASFAAGTAIRGGIPVVFPQFAGRGPMVKHGFARLLDWRFSGVESNASGTPAAVLELCDSPATLAHWPARFRARLTVALAPSSLEVALDIHNDGSESFEFTAALHTYLQVHNLDAVRLTGLEAVPFVNSADNWAMMPAAGEAVRFDGEIDRIYPDTGNPLVLDDGDRAMRIAARGFRDTVVWNPGTALASSIADLGAGEHGHFVCVESGIVVEPVTLLPGAWWTGSQQLLDDA